MPKRTTVGASRAVRSVVLSAMFLLASCPSILSQERALTLSEALSRAVAADFGIPAARERVRGAEAGVRQAGRFPNPSVGVEVENFAGSGSHRGVQRAETTLFAQQTIELGNKREARTGLAKTELGATRARGAVRVLDLMRDVELAYAETLTTAALLQLAEDRLAIAQQLQSELARRSQAGRDPQFMSARADAQVALEQIARDVALENGRIARVNLAGYWRGGADYVVDLAAFDNVASAGETGAFNVDVQVLEAEGQIAAARVGVERARTIPDPVVRLGVRHFSETRDSALIAGVAIPLPLFDTNRDNISKAEAERRAAELEVTQAKRSLRRELTRLYSRTAANRNEARRVQSEVVPRAEQAVRLIREGLERGAFSYVEYTDAQRTLNDARTRRIDALRAFHQDNAAINRLVGRHTRLNVKKARRP